MSIYKKEVKTIKTISIGRRTYMNMSKITSTKQNNKKSLARDVLKLSILSLVITVLITSLYITIRMNNLVVTVSEDKATASQNIVQIKIDEIRSNLEKGLNILTSNTDFISAIGEEDSSTTGYSYIMFDFKNENIGSNLTITNTEGVVIASTGHNSGQTLFNNPLIKEALAGSGGSNIERIFPEYFSLNVVKPINFDGNIIGVLIADYNLENLDFVDGIKNYVNSEITIFENDLRVNTTIIQDGRRLIGTKLDPEVAEIVINNKQEYIGKAGKGFAVVADEVRNLALKSAEAAKNTSELIFSSTNAVKKGLKIAKDTELSLQNVVEKINQANSFVNEIAEASQKQKESIKEANIGIEQITEVVHSNSSSAEELAASSEELSGQAYSLKEMVGKYRLG
jgi:hypothetical protein